MFVTSLQMLLTWRFVGLIFTGVFFLNRCLILSCCPIPIDSRENLGWSRVRGHGPGLFQLPWVHFICWFVWEIVSLPWWRNKNTQVQKEKVTEDIMVMSLLKCASHFRNNSLPSNEVISWDRDQAKINLLILKKIQLPKANLDRICVNNRRKCKKAEIFLIIILL